METLELLGVALGFATLAGLNLYLTTFVAGLAVHFDWIKLAEKYEQLDVLGNPWIVGTAGVLFFFEFFADKIPWVDSSWDVVHTLIRPIGGAMLALTALGELDPAVSVVAGLLAGSASLTTHLTKASTRLLVNLSPEPVSNAVASTAEDGLVLGGLGLMAFAPTIGFVVFVLMIAFAIWFLNRSSHVFRSGMSKLRERWFRKTSPTKISDSV